MNALFLDVAGISDAGFAEVDQRFAAMPLGTAQKLLNTKRISMIGVKARPGVDVARLVSELNAEAARSGLSLDIRDWARHPYGDLYVRTLDYLDIFRGFVMIVIFFIVSMSVLNTFMKLVVERTKEIGTLRSLGFLPSVIVRLFAIEGLLLAGLGTAIGGVSAAIGTVVINFAKVPYKAGILSEPVPFVVSFTPWLYLAVAVFLGTFAALTATAASWKQARLKISDALAS
jgi:putative ABC transport system permease protein